MKSWLISTAGKLGGYHVARLLTRQQPKILMYHRFSEAQSPHAVSRAGFERQLRIIKRWFNPMTLTQLAQSIEKDGRAPENAVVITVDDGYQDFYEIAYPLLRLYEVPATFFVTTGFVNQELWLWPDQVSWLLARMPEGIISHQTVAGLTLDMRRPKEELWQTLIDHFLSIANVDRLSGIADLEQLCGQELPATAPPKYAGSQWSQLEEMQRNGIEIGGHTYSHPSLGHMTSDEVSQELERTSNLLTENLGSMLRSFCYPNGSPEDYSDSIKQQVKDAGFTAAVTAFSDRYNVKLDFAWRRFVGTEEDFQFHKSLFGVEHLGNALRKTVRCEF